MLGVSWDMLSTLNAYLQPQELVFSQSLYKHIASASLGQFPDDMHFIDFSVRSKWKSSGTSGAAFKSIYNS